MNAFELPDLLARRQHSGQPYLEFLRERSLSVGLYVLPAEGVDRQEPHTEDEVYYVLSGRGAIQVGAESRPVEVGSVIFVAATVPHHFHSITQDLQIVVFFAPAEYSQKDA